ncbi:MAG: hypothetical protein LLF97_02370, partial [Planctomycetaceae bacterium]|nr:hypothetical protein [Planctomycetaceae bacterium]
MASIAKDKNGCRRILFVAPDGRRPTIRLGKVSQRAAESIKYRVEQLLECLMLNRPMEADLAQWVTDLEPRLAKKLARFPSHVVCDWLGNSEDVARKHYYQTTDAHFAEATAGPVESGAESGAQTAQNAAQRVRVGNRGDSQNESQLVASTPLLQFDA